ncbi:16S rRNA (guanine(527)-N(7))-methyltransferase RsmG [Actinoplanes sp. G11-F43]|uniref:16S rRNA (guanine(527)-N(7))-methyltransferase RsmG n=1 Tax=Actinoplanes sp. G11-F43 TaxID=3424130 RepID=UPI003D3265A1
MSSPRHDAGDSGPGVVSPGPSSARQVFGDRLDLAGRYAELLATDGVVRGLIGPREAPRLWERHLINCGVMETLIPDGASVIDVGSGAGLPGLVLAIARPDLRITLVEPLARRTAFLDEAVESLGLDNVSVVRGRAEDVDLPGADVVTARAVAALDKLAGWCLPLAAVGGRLLAMKGSSAAEEIAAAQEAVTSLGGGEAVIHLCGVGLIDPPTTVVEIPVLSRAPSRTSPRTSTRATSRASSRSSSRSSSRRR